MSRSVWGCMASLCRDYTAPYGCIQTVERLIKLIWVDYCVQWLRTCSDVFTCEPPNVGACKSVRTSCASMSAPHCYQQLFLQFLVTLLCCFKLSSTKCFDAVLLPRSTYILVYHMYQHVICYLQLDSAASCQPPGLASFLLFRCLSVSSSMSVCVFLDVWFPVCLCVGLQ